MGMREARKQIHPMGIEAYLGGPTTYGEGPSPGPGLGDKETRGYSHAGPLSSSADGSGD